MVNAIKNNCNNCMTKKCRAEKFCMGYTKPQETKFTILELAAEKNLNEVVKLLDIAGLVFVPGENKKFELVKQYS